MGGGGGTKQLVSCQLHPGGGWGEGDDESDNTPLGSLQKGSFDIVGAEVELVVRPGGVVGIMIEIGNELRCVSREEVLEKSHSGFVQIWSIRIIKWFYLEIFAHLFLFHYNSLFIGKGAILKS